MGLGMQLHLTLVFGSDQEVAHGRSLCSTVQGKELLELSASVLSQDLLQHVNRSQLVCVCCPCTVPLLSAQTDMQ